VRISLIIESQHPPRTNHRPFRHIQRERLMRWLYACMISGDATWKSYHDSRTLKRHTFAWRPVYSDLLECIVSSPDAALLEAIVAGLETTTSPIFRAIAADPIPSPDPLQILQPITGIKLRASSNQSILYHDPAFLPALRQHLAHRLTELEWPSDAVTLAQWWQDSATLQLQGDAAAAAAIVESGLGVNTASGLGMLADPDTVFRWHATELPHVQTQIH